MGEELGSEDPAQEGEILKECSLPNPSSRQYLPRDEDDPDGHQHGTQPQTEEHQHQESGHEVIGIAKTEEDHRESGGTGNEASGESQGQESTRGSLLSTTVG